MSSRNSPVRPLMNVEIFNIHSPRCSVRVSHDSDDLFENLSFFCSVSFHLFRSFQRGRPPSQRFCPPTFSWSRWSAPSRRCHELGTYNSEMSSCKACWRLGVRRESITRPWCQQSSAFAWWSYDFSSIPFPPCQCTYSPRHTKLTSQFSWQKSLMLWLINVQLIFRSFV